MVEYEAVKIKDITADECNVVFIAKVTSVGDIWGNAVNLYLEDATGSIRASLWDEACNLVKIGAIKVGQTLKIKGYVRRVYNEGRVRGVYNELEIVIDVVSGGGGIEHINIKSHKINEFKSLDNEENHNKGVIFEQYVADLFAPSYFSLYDCTRDNFKMFGRPVESDQNPDLTMRCILTNELFSIECKFRSSANNDKVNWARNDQIINYLSYAAKNRRPVFVVIGLGGSPDNPDRMFCLPIEEARYPDLYLSMLRRYERNPSQKFFWKNGNLS